MRGAAGTELGWNAGPGRAVGTREGTHSCWIMSMCCVCQNLSAKGLSHSLLMDGHLIAPTAFVFAGISFVGSCVLFSSVIPGRRN